MRELLLTNWWINQSIINNNRLTDTCCCLHAPVKFLLRSHGDEKQPEHFNFSFFFFFFAEHYDVTVRLTFDISDRKIDIRVKFCCNYHINYWVMSINVFCKVTGSLDVWPPKSNQFILDNKSDEIPSRRSWTTQEHYSSDRCYCWHGGVKMVYRLFENENKNEKQRQVGNLKILKAARLQNEQTQLESLGTFQNISCHVSGDQNGI